MIDLLPSNARRFDALLADAQRVGRLPSIVGAVVEAGRLVWTGAAGDCPGPAAGDPLDTQYRIGSITKTFTAVLVLQAHQEGLLELDAPVSTYVADSVYGDRTLRALLSHSAGIPSEPAGPWWERSTGSDFAGLLVANRDVPARHTAGSKFGYSNLGPALLGEAVSRVRGEGWWSLVQARILAPLGMERTSYQPTAPHAQGYSVSHLLGTLTPEPHTDTGAMAPAGQLWSTLADLARYAGFVLAGHPDVLPLALLEDASAPVIAGQDGYGLGFRAVDTEWGQLVGHTGTMPGFMASFFVDRARGSAFIGFANGTTGQASLPLATAMLGTLAGCTPRSREPWRPATEVPDEVRELVGAWYWGETAFEIRWNGTELEMVETRPNTAYEEYHREDRGWIGTDGTQLEVVRRPDGSVAHLLSETYLFTRMPYDPASPVPGGTPHL